MTFCDGRDPPTKVLLLFLSVGFGALLLFVLNVIFVYKWHFELSVEDRQASIPRLSAILVTAITVERCLRLVETYLRFYSSYTITEICYHINNAISVAGIFGTLLILILTKLKDSFMNSTYAVSIKEIRVLYILIVMDILCLYVFWTLNGIKSVYSSHTGQIILILFLILILLLSLIIIGMIDVGFASRLRALVASQTARRRSSTGLDSTIHAMNRTSNPPMTDPNITVSTTTVSITAVSPPTSPYRDEIFNLDEMGFKQQPRLDSIRQSTISYYQPTHQTLLRTATRSMVLAVWTSISFLIIVAAGFLFIIGDCQAHIIAEGCLDLAFTLINLSISFSLAHSKAEYTFFCSRFDRCLSKLVAWQTTVEMFEMSQKIDPQIEESIDVTVD